MAGSLTGYTLVDGPNGSIRVDVSFLDRALTGFVMDFHVVSNPDTFGECRRIESGFRIALDLLTSVTFKGPCPKNIASSTTRKGFSKVEYLFRNRNEAMNYARKQLGHGAERIYDSSGKWIGWQNKAGDKVYWGHGDWGKGLGKSSFPHLNYKIGGQKGHYFLQDKIKIEVCGNLLLANLDYKREPVNIDEIVERSGDSVLCDCTFSNGVLTLHLEMEELDSILLLRVQTKKMDCMNINKLSDIEKNCRIELVRVSDKLEVENGYYVAEKSFSRFMKSCKNGFNLAYGMKSNDEAYLLNIIGYIRLVTCVIEKISSDLKWELKQ